MDSTLFIASLIISAAVPCIGVFIAVRSAKERRLKLRLLISGNSRMRPNIVRTLPVSWASFTILSIYSLTFG